MAEDGGKEVGGGKVGEAELLGEAGGGVGMVEIKTAGAAVWAQYCAHTS